MPRQPRFQYPGACYHVMCRGNRGDPIFLGRGDREMFLATLADVCKQMGWRVHVYVLMDNHYHLLLETPEANLVAGMRWFQGTYTQRFNALHRVRGHLFQGRYKAIPVQVGKGDLVYFKEVSSYIHLNPFRAGICGEGKDEALEFHEWSSYAHYVHWGERCPRWLVRSKVYRTQGISFKNPDAGRLYRAVLEKKMRWENNPRATSVEGDPILAQIRRGWYIGEEGFGKDLLKDSDLSSSGDNLRGAIRRRHDERGAEAKVKACLRLFSLKEDALLALSNSSLPKQATSWFLNQYSSMTIQWIADRLQMKTRSNASYQLHRFGRNETEEAKAIREELRALVE